MKATIKQIIKETPRVLTFVVEPETSVSFKTGQAMRWNLPGLKIGRLFSVACAGGENMHELRFTIRIFEDGKFTSHLRGLKVGDSIELSGPYGNFIFEDTRMHDVGLIAGGSGISVLRAIYCNVLEKDTKHKVHLVFSVLNIDEVIYKDELAELAKKYPNFTYTIVVTKPHPSWQGHTGFVTKGIFDQEFKDYKEEFYICGPQAFIDCSEGLLHEAGVTDDRIHIDHWTFYAPKLMK
ncbi:MAG: FAD-dependent oxidoreductase [Candidatus Komeilibacteria bacterium]|nr:FAD-dependent oxidoreductase [Candidatus Komeilibacteria bacterium]